MIIIFVGPQGAGKTTHAKLIKSVFPSNKRVIITSLDTYALLHHKFLNLLSKFHGIMLKYYGNLPALCCPNPYVIMKLLFVLLIFHLIGAVISFFKLLLLSLYYDIIIEDQGYVLKQIADLRYLIWRSRSYWKVGSMHVKLNFLKIIERLLLCLLPKSSIIILLKADYKDLRNRYVKRGSPIEPVYYISFSEKIFDRIVKGYRYIEVNTSLLSKHETHVKICQYLANPLKMELMGTEKVRNALMFK